MRRAYLSDADRRGEMHRARCTCSILVRSIATRCAACLFLTPMARKRRTSSVSTPKLWTWSTLTASCPALSGVHTTRVTQKPSCRCTYCANPNIYAGRGSRLNAEALWLHELQTKLPLHLLCKPKHLRRTRFTAECRSILAA